MNLNKAEREAFRKRLQNFIVKNANLQNNEIVAHFLKEGIARQTIYDNLKRLQTSQPISDKNHTGRPTS